jgi:hypothetical protein
MTDQDKPGLLMEFILAVLAPMLIGGSITDPTLARLAAQEAIGAYNAKNKEELMTVAQIAGLAIAALDNLRLSAAADMSVSLKLKLRGNTAALNRAVQANTNDLRRRRQDREAAEQDARATTEALAALDEARAAGDALASLDQARANSEALDQSPAATPPKPATNRAEAWAGAMTGVAVEFAANLDRLPPKQRRADVIRIGLLTEAAQQLRRTGDFSKADLLTSTSLTGDQTAQPSNAGTANRASQCSPMSSPVA